MKKSFDWTYKRQTNYTFSTTYTDDIKQLASNIFLYTVIQVENEEKYHETTVLWD